MKEGFFFNMPFLISLFCNSADKICTPGYCKNGGTCVVVGTKPFCKCPPNYLPPDCGKQIITTGTGFFRLLVNFVNFF